MDIEQIRQALERQLGDGYKTYAPRRDRLLVHCPDGTLLIAADLNEYAAIGRALQSAAGEGPLIPLADAVRVVEEACMSERRRCEGDYYGDMYGGAAIDGVEENAIAALQALGGGDV